MPIMIGEDLTVLTCRMRQQEEDLMRDPSEGSLGGKTREVIVEASQVNNFKDIPRISASNDPFVPAPGNPF